MKNIVMMLVAGCVVGLLTGCGVPKEEHAAVVAELHSTSNTVEVLKGEKASLEESLAAEQKKARSMRIELDDASKTAEEMKAKEAATATALAAEQRKVADLESDLTAAKSATGAAQDHSSELQAALDQLKADYAHLQNRFDQLKKNMLALDGTPPSAAVAAEPVKKAPPKTTSGDAGSAADLLDAMGAE